MSLSQEQQTENTEPCTSPGNPAVSSITTSATRSMKSATNPNIGRILYRTTSSAYGSFPPTPESSPHSYHPKSHRFTKEQSRGGMYQDNSLNTALDRSRVHDCPSLHYTL
uniref:Uncharacterized protein n=2 Tax=Nothobranchius TaxID=28779 RepID=A0A1A8E7P7_NOTKA|nr:piercer of microtubule wall 2 protein-like [Nothobranchius furzeri]